MSKADFNKEIVLLRHDVRKARVGVVWKLTKEVKLLQKRTHGDDKQIEKCKRKLKKLISEIKSLKKVKDDDISKFALTTTKSIEAVLADPRSKFRTRVMSRVAFHKALKTKIEALRDKFPNYQEYLSAKKKSQSKVKTTTNERDVKVSNDEALVDEEIPESDEDNVSVAELSQDSKENMTDIDESSSEILHEEKEESFQAKPTNDQEKSKKKQMRIIKREPRDTTRSVQKKPETIKVVSKMATVKKLKLDGDQIQVDDNKEMIVEQNTEDAESKEDAVHIEREVDSFFLTANGKSNYLRVAVPKRDGGVPNDGGQRDDEKSTFSRNYNQNFFNKNDRNENKYNKRDNIKFVGDKKLNKFRNDKNNESVKKHINQLDITKNEELHPSWIAKKKQQDILKQGFQGQKIVFD